MEHIPWSIVSRTGLPGIEPVSTSCVSIGPLSRTVRGGVVLEMFSIEVNDLELEVEGRSGHLSPL